MIYVLTEYYLGLKIASVNSGYATADKLQAIDTNLDINFLPASLRDKSYIIKFDDIDYNTQDLFPSGKIQFQFLIAKREITYYKTVIDTYLVALANKIADPTSPSGTSFPYENTGIASGYKIYGIEDLGLQNLDKLDSGGMYLMPELRFKFTMQKN